MQVGPGSSQGSFEGADRRGRERDGGRREGGVKGPPTKECGGEGRET